MRKAVICMLGLMLALGTVAQAQDLDEVLSNYYEAMGGLDKLKSVETLKMSGRMSMGQGIEAPISRTHKRPGKIRQEFTFQGMSGIVAFDGETAWMHMPFMGQTAPELMPESDAKELMVDADIDGPLVDAEEKGIALELIGTEDIEGTEAFHIQATRDDGKVEHHYLDAEYFIPIKIKRTSTVQGQEMDLEITLGDYKEVDGLLFAHALEVAGQQGAQAFTLDSVEVNLDVDDSIFKMPEAPAEDAPSEG